MPMSRGAIKGSKVMANRIRMTPMTFGVKSAESHRNHRKRPMAINKRPPTIIPP
jgi:hypothetical protein